jgi:hypothetical protein
VKAWIGFGVLLLAGCATTPLLPEALTEWAARTGYQLVVPDCPAVHRPAKPIQASDPQDELEQLLAGTRHHFEIINPRSVAIVCPAESPR